MEKKSIYIQKYGSIGWIVLNQPSKRNAITKSMWESIPVLLEEAEKDESILCVVIRGCDEKAFAAGADISEFNKIHSNEKNSKEYNKIVHRAEKSLKDFIKPTIAMIQGPCIGGGCGLALACDLRFADNNSKFAIPPSKLGLVYSLQGTKSLIDKVGQSFASDMIFSGRIVDSSEALRVNLIDRLFNPEKILSETTLYCEILSKRSQFSIQSTKKIVKLISNGITEDTEETLKLFDLAFQGNDYKEGTSAFLEKRDPEFKWR